MKLDFDLTNPEHVRDPHGVFRSLREREPVMWSDKLRGWVLTRYDDVKTALYKPEYSADRIRPFVDAPHRRNKSAIQALGSLLTQWVVFNDPPQHTRVRNLLNKSFTPNRMAAMRPRIESVVRQLLESLPSHGKVDFIADFAFPLPATVIAGMLGAPSERIADIRDWSDKIGKFVFNSVEDERYDEARQGLFQMADFFRELFKERRAHPEDDIISLMLAAQDDGDMLSEDEVTSNCILLLFAGHETTTNLIANGLYHLCQHPEQLRLLRSDPSLIDSAVEEMLRFEGPTGALVRIAKDDIALGGKQIAKGQRVFPMILAANRDPRRFEQPDTFDIAREDNPHLGFGHGLHFCMGAPLARLETCIAIEAFLDRFDSIALQAQAPVWKPQLLLRGMESLDIEIRSSAGAA